MTPAELLAAAKCLRCLSQQQSLAILIALACLWAGGDIPELTESD